MTFRIDLGDARVDQVTEVDRWPFPVGELFPAATAAQVRAAAAQLGDAVDGPDGLVVLAIHTYLVRAGGLTVLVDAGNGNGKHRPALTAHDGFDTDYATRFAATGVRPADVDVVVVTHLHPDHAGGLTTNDGDGWRPTFPRAEHLFHDGDLTALRRLAARTPAGIEGDLAATHEDSIAPVLRGGRWHTTADGHRIIDTDDVTLTVREAPGHTPGHLVLELTTPHGGAVFSGDAIHHPLQLLHPHLTQAGDQDPDLARSTRHALLTHCATRGRLLLTAHFPGDAPLDVTTTDGRFEVTPRRSAPRSAPEGSACSHGIGTDGSRGDGGHTRTC